MPLEIKILTGARAGQMERVDKPLVVIGRHAASDMRFDPHQDLDVSGRHAEIRAAHGKYTIHDIGSTNGTFVNGRRIDATGVELRDGDKLRFGAKGPEAEARMLHAPRSTEQRIAAAVDQQTAGLKRYMIAALVVLAVGLAGAYYMGHRQSEQRVEELRKLLAENDSKFAILQGGLGRSGDTAMVNELQRQMRSLRERLPGATTDQEREKIKTDIAEIERQLNSMIRMDLPSINTSNAPAVALIVSDVGGKAFAGSGFAITPEGLIITNRHNVVNDMGDQATRLAVKFRDTGDWLPAHVVKIANETEGDLALIQVDVPDKTFPTVTGLQGSSDNAGEGASVATIGFPLGYDTAMEGEGNNFVAKSTLIAGSVSKRTSTVLQIDSYAAHGSSGSPVFNARGLVVGVVYGGPTEANGRIVYAVPPEMIAAFIPDEHKHVIKD